jgi:transcriptional regulator with XRE-family HTH domain
LTPQAEIQIGKRLRQEREALGLTREDVASRAGLSYKTIERIEAGDSQPRRSTLVVLEGALYKDDPPPIEVGRVRKVEA